ncbi:MAG: insulinase family protein [Clostridia bacterium]|nr:insulinase family protein [Clostridia bacterium]
MMLKKFNITDGVTLNVIPTDKFKTNYLSFNFVQYLDRKSASQNALILQVLLRGTEKHKDIASIKTALDELYAASIESKVFKRGEYQVCGITASWLADRYSIDGTKITDGTISMLEELLFEPYTEDGIFSKDYVQSEKNDLIDDIRALINNKNSYAVTRCKEEMCRGEAFGISEYGDEESVKKITAEELFNAYKRFLETSRIEIFYVGSGDVDELCNRIEKMFVGKKREYKQPQKTVVKYGVSEVRNVTEKISAAQGKLSLGFRTGCVVGDEDYSAFPVFVEMYGNSPVSKLFMNVREKLSLCYYCRAIPDGVKGIMVVASGIEVSNKETAQNEILAQLENVKQGKITDEELILAKKSLKNAYNELNDSPPALEGWYLTRCLSGLDDTHEEVCERFMNVTKNDVINVARKLQLDTVYFLEGTLKGEGESDDE